MEGLVVPLTQRLKIAAAGEEAHKVKSGQILVGTILAVARAHGVNQLRETLLQRLIVQPVLLQRLRTPVRDQHVCALQQLKQRFLTGRVLRVQRDAALVRVLQLPGRVLIHIQGTALARCRVTQGIALRGLDLDDIRALIRQETTGRCRGHEVRQLNDLHAGQKLPIRHKYIPPLFFDTCAGIFAQRLYHPGFLLIQQPA